MPRITPAPPAPKPPRAPAARDRRLADILCVMRDESCRDAATVARALGWSAPKISRIEHCTIGIDMDDLAALLTYYKIPAPRRTQVLTYARQVAEQQAESFRRRRYAGEVLPPVTEPAVCEARAALAWAPAALPRPLRTAGYAAAVEFGTQNTLRIPPAEIRRVTAAAAAEAARLTARKNPLTLQAVIDESVLSRQFGGSEIMAAQMRQLLDLGGRSNVDLRVLPLDGGGGPRHIPPFTHLVFPETAGLPLPDAVLISHLHPGGDLRLEVPRDTYLYGVAFDELRRAAADRPDSAVIIKSHLARWENGT